VQDNSDDEVATFVATVSDKKKRQVRSWFLDTGWSSHMIDHKKLGNEV
jgi:hypothetical protein